jgi:hypothetical protein
MCDFRSGTIECQGDGYCRYIDLDSDDDPARNAMPCPRCNTLQWLIQQKSEAESSTCFAGIVSGTGVDIWESAVNIAQQENPVDIERCLRTISTVKALYESITGKVETKVFSYT